MRDLIRGYAAAVFETTTDAEQAGIVSELTAFGGALLEFANLRVALTDATVAPTVRRSVVADLLGDKASAATVALAGFVAYYERASEIGPTISSLVLLAERDDARAIVESPAGRAAARERVRGYAERIFEELKGTADVDRIEDELFSISRLLDGHAELRRVLSDTNLDYPQRAAILSGLLADKAASATVQLSSYVLRAGRTRDLVGTFEWLVELAARERGRRVAEVRSAVPLDAAETERLAIALGRLVNRTVDVRVIDDPTVLGGIFVSVGDLVIDGTVRLRFERLRDLLVQSS